MAQCLFLPSVAVQVVSGAEGLLSPVSVVGEMDDSAVFSEAVRRRKKHGNERQRAFRKGSMTEFSS